MRYLPSETNDAAFFNLSKNAEFLHKQTRINHGGTPQKSCLQQGGKMIVAKLSLSLP